MCGWPPVSKGSVARDGGYDGKRLVWMEPFERMDEAIARETQIKSGNRKDELTLIERDNPQWRDLYESLNA
jgi:putative endonuclease